MKTVTVEPTAVGQATGTQQRAADQVATQANAERIDTGTLAATFGLIGAGFLSALAEVGAQRTRTLDTLRTAHSTTSSKTADASRAYCDCDEAGARAVAV
ncbi:ESX-1 secretion-associated protein [Gordonia sp. HY002]|uniref:type VII secretion target n=1 Tax=Gordonia zhenghanii TaxID=2911516 RepID=UPI001EEFAD87|nr:type VII secretion target [Gordonia zhenghanii]MCF8570521.1 ESX-1 secretion-associated protein [Gordonia zhenghanii]MCF8602522.1 ESX-1 secretion-associated protein [Gordonia zhenghanii]